MQFFVRYSLMGVPTQPPSPDPTIHWIRYVDADTDEPVEPPPLILLGRNMYGFRPERPSHCGLFRIDGSPIAGNRYNAILPSDRWACVAWSIVDGEPMDPPPAPSWRVLLDAETGAEIANPPPITTVAGSIHTVPYSEPRMVGVLDLRFHSSTNQPDPQFVEFDSKAPSGAGDDTPPEVEIVNPPVGSAITPSTPITLKVTDDQGLGRVMIYARYEGREAAEVIHDGGAYLAPYLDSTRVAIPGGYVYTLRRSGGWAGPISMWVRAVDKSGNEVQVL